MPIIFGLLGLLVGSFLNVIIYRVPLKRSIVTPPSACATCGTRIKTYDNIPVVSWILLRGRCRQCKSRISADYLFVELGTGIFFGIIALKFNSNTPLLLIAFLYLAASTIALALIDLKTHTLPNRIIFPSYFVGAILLASDALVNQSYAAIYRAFFGAISLGFFYFMLTLIYPGGMGMGDVKFAALIGLFLGYLGWGKLLVATFLAFVLGGIFSLCLILFRGADRKSEIPFGPWIFAGAWIGIFFGATIFHRYLSLFGLTNYA